MNCRFVAEDFWLVLYFLMWKIPKKTSEGKKNKQMIRYGINKFEDKEREKKKREQTYSNAKLLYEANIPTIRLLWSCQTTIWLIHYWLFIGKSCHVILKKKKVFEYQRKNKKREEKTEKENERELKNSHLSTSIENDPKRKSCCFQMK